LGGATSFALTDPGYSFGGCRQVDTTATRNAIPLPYLQNGMIVWVEATDIYYKLRSTWAGTFPTVDGDWEVFSGPGSGVTGSGNSTSIALWNTATDLTANVFFTRSNATSIVINNQGFTADTAVDVDRYIDPAGSDSNSGTAPGPANAWLTTGHAISQCPAMGSGIYRINCAAGTYPLASISTPDCVQLYSSPQYGNTLIEILGDPTTPANVIFDSNGTIVTHNSPNTHLRINGVRFTGDATNICIDQQAGFIWIQNCEFDNFAVISQSLFPGTVFSIGLGLDIPITNCPLGFVADAGAAIINAAGINMTLPIGGSGLFQIGGNSIYGAFAASAITVTGIGGNLFTVSSGFLFLGDGAQYDIDGLSSFIYADGRSYIKLDEGNTVIIANSGSWVSVNGESFFEDSPDTDWQITASPGGNFVGQGSQISSAAVINGVDPFIDYITYNTDVDSRYAQDNRYTDKPCFTMMGNLPVSYTLNYMSPAGIPSVEYPIYIAKARADIVGIRVYTRTGNGAAQTDTYQIYVNGAAPAVPFGCTITNTNFGENNIGSVPLVAGDRVSVVFTSAAATTAEDVTVEFDVRIVT
jgi:hypothetical protein